LDRLTRERQLWIVAPRAPLYANLYGAPSHA
jgi:hypothetical protein